MNGPNEALADAELTALAAIGQADSVRYAAEVAEYKHRLGLPDRDSARKPEFSSAAIDRIQAELKRRGVL